MSLPAGAPRKPKALRKGDNVAIFAPSSPADQVAISGGLTELSRLGYTAWPSAPLFSPQGYFAGSTEDRLNGFLLAAGNADIAAILALRGGYGANYLLDGGLSSQLGEPKCVIGFSDLTLLQIYLWQKCGWVTFYGPMLAAGFNQSADDAHGYDENSFLQAVSNTEGNWSLNLNAEALVSGEAEGRVLGGCLTLLQTALGTPWQLDARGAILLLEDRGMKPYQLDRALRHLLQAGQFREVAGFLLGDFPDCDPPVAGGPTARDVCQRILAPLGVPLVYGAPVGPTNRPMLTIPLGIRARLSAISTCALAFLEPAVL